MNRARNQGLDLVPRQFRGCGSRLLPCGVQSPALAAQRQHFARSEYIDKRCLTFVSELTIRRPFTNERKIGTAPHCTSIEPRSAGSDAVVERPRTTDPARARAADSGRFSSLQLGTALRCASIEPRSAGSDASGVCLAWG